MNEPELNLPAGGTYIKPAANGSRLALDDIARVAHEVNRAYCAALGDTSQLPWEQAPEWQRESARAGVELHALEDVGPEASHLAWLKHKVDTGWVYGEVKDEVARTHPCITAFNRLPREQQAKDYIFRGVVHALRHYLAT